MHSVENREIPSHRKNIPWWNQLFSNLLVTSLLSRNFCQKSVSENFLFFHTMVWKVPITIFTEKSIFSPCTVWKLPKFALTLFWQKFRQSNSFTVEITKLVIWWNIFSVRVNFRNFHTVPWKEFSKELISRTFFREHDSWFLRKNEHVPCEINVCKKRSL